jgi:hypothetical protein
MPNRSRKKLPDPNLMALAIVEAVTGETLVERPEPPPSGKDPAAVARGMKGGPKGGVMRAASMTPERRKEVARKAAKTRWSKKPPAES